MPVSSLCFIPVHMHLDLCAKKKQTQLVCRRPPRPAAMHANVLSRVMLLRQTLKQCSDAEAVQDLVQQTNVLMQMVLKREVSMDLSSTGRDSTLLGKVGELVQMCTAIGDDELKAHVSAHLQSILSACVSSCMCCASCKPNASDAMSAKDKLQHVRVSLLSSFQT